MRRSLAPWLLLAALAQGARGRAHDLPNEQVDRSIQATARPGGLEVDYEVSLAELTLVQDLRRLVTELPGSDREALFNLYGREVGPLIAKGLLVSVDREPIDVRCRGFDLAVEEHPRYTFHLAASLPPRGRLVIRDTNYLESKGTSRLALRGRGPLMIRGDGRPADVTEIPIRPTWLLSDAEERRTRQVEADFAPASVATAPGSPAVDTSPRPTPPPATRPAPAGGLARLLDRAASRSLPLLWLIALGLGAAHAVQPGHGKTLVAAAVVGGRWGMWRGSLLALTTTLAHTGSVLAIAAALWATRSTRYAELNAALARAAGFAIAAVGLWRLGRHLAGYGEHDGEGAAPDLGDRGLLGLGLAGGLVPCWDAVLLIVLAEALGRLALGLFLLSAFSLGMAAVLVAVAATSARLRRLVSALRSGTAWERRLGLLSALILTTLGLGLMAGPFA
jgi:nickel/cobalt transporter (NicO) family protein